MIMRGWVVRAVDGVAVIKIIMTTTTTTTKTAHARSFFVHNVII
jgi:hypothetical protein